MYISSLAVLALATVSVSAQQLCNGYAEFCNKHYNSLTYLLTHNAYGYVANPASNQACPIPTQLTDGVRGLKLSAIRSSNATTAGTDANSIQLCHTSCTILNGGSAVDTLTKITEWVKANPNEVVTIMWNNLGNFTPTAFEAAYNASGLTDYVHTQAYGNLTWPTLGEMISSGKRVVNFVDEGTDTHQVAWLLPEWDFCFETPYNNKNESSFSCTIDRPTEPNDPTESLYIMNHFLYGTLRLGALEIEIPQKGTANVTNGNSSLLAQAQQCKSTFGRQPTFLEIDFYNKGNTLEIAAALNNVSYTRPSQLQCDVYEATASTGGSGSSSDASTLMYSSTVLLSLVATVFFTCL
ncbi:PLC-like phosphodiesterase [Gilbertella persicaria]|uniref:PLC-like phosphodiesterase n=1 Tax=Gilbertella persicaria TaxID=101096 RepID=UPI00221E993F|nr:PLC-like phosphodiesterase [Gilbertella persicaria]KAI8047560.1 PLC-like phosphodiesterase [Gilbertella persicaria]